jgi:hypothetical protein
MDPATFVIAGIGIGIALYIAYKIERDSRRRES